MGNCNHKKNPLQRSGTDQKERLLPGMQKGYVAVDEKEFPDWIVFATQFSAYLKYYELNGASNGDWAIFFNNDISAILGTIAIQDVDAYKDAIKERFDFLKDVENGPEILKAKRNLNELFGIALTFYKAVDDILVSLPAASSTAAGITNLIRSGLSVSLKRLLQYYKAAQDLNFLHAGSTGLSVLGKPVKEASEIVNAGLSEVWWNRDTSFTTWEDYYNSITAEKSIFGKEVLLPEIMQINHAANHNLFAGIFDQLLKSFGKLVNDAEAALMLSIEKSNEHAPHYALFLAFLHLYKYVQKDINAISQRHLDFYYKEVLQLRQRNAVANSAHILTQLSKPVNELLLAEDTGFKAGKDNLGKEVTYALTGEAGFNKAKVVQLRSVYFGDAVDDNGVANKSNGRLFAAPAINSADGAGAELLSPQKEWHPFANRLFIEGKVQDVLMPKAEIGFAVASHYLFLQEGQRTIRIKLATTNDNALLNKHFEIFLTTEKGWYKVATTIATEISKLDDGTNCVDLIFTLRGDEPAITDYNQKIHEGNLGVEVPVAKVMLLNSEAAPYEYHSLSEIRLNNLELAVSVGMGYSGFNQEGLKQLLVNTDAGIVDTSKPFMPFGPQGVNDTAMVIGNREIFTKQNTNVRVNIEWANMPGSTSTLAYGNATPPGARVRFLTKGVWENILDLDFMQIFNQGSLASIAFNIPNEVISVYQNAYTAYNQASAQGFIKLVLNGDFGYKDYLSSLSVYLINKANEVADSENPVPVEPYAPLIKSIYVSYASTSKVVNLGSNDAAAYNAKPVSLFHIYPFGDAEQHRFLSGGQYIYLLPQFQHLDENAAITQHQGEFYIGFEDLFGRQVVNVLFQVLDGSADPSITKPEEHVNWSYLSNNKWLGFDKQHINDGTGQLIQSGIISFIIPAEANKNNSILPANLIWVRCAVKEKVNAVCKLISVDAQAATVKFADNNNALDFAGNMLPAGSISKLKVPQAAVKKVVQPYPSFDGRPMESGEAFYVRVSERLRHKARAITIWDYEHLILEAFPLIYKVKCLNHTKSIDADYNEVAPGHVTIITIPDLNQRNDINSLKPYTSQAVLKAIKDFLTARISCHVKLHVVNPVFEEVQIKFKLRLAKGFDDFTMYSNKLREEITNFLSPWAFSNDVQINFGGSISKSVLINFIEERPYVDFITDVILNHIYEDGAMIVPDVDEATASTAKSILVSVPASKHVVEEILPGSIIEIPECDYINQTMHFNE